MSEPPWLFMPPPLDDKESSAWWTMSGLFRLSGSGWRSQRQSSRSGWEFSQALLEPEPHPWLEDALRGIADHPAPLFRMESSGEHGSDQRRRMRTHCRRLLAQPLRRPLGKAAVGRRSICRSTSIVTAVQFASVHAILLDG